MGVPINKLKQRLLARKPHPDNRQRAEAFWQWQETPFGRYLLDTENQYCQQYLPAMPGFRAMQLGIAGGRDLLQTFDYLHKFRLVNLPPARGDFSAISLYEALPLPSDTVDVALLYHVLDFSSRPHKVLSEAARVLVPGGQLILLGFNPISWLGLKRLPAHLLGKSNFWYYRALSSRRILDWLQLLGFQMQVLRFGCYAPALQSERMLLRMGRVEKVASACNLPLGNFYLIAARKQVLRPVLKPQPHWLEQKIAGLNGASEPAAKNRHSRAET